MTAATAPMKAAMTSHHHHSMSECRPQPPPAPPPPLSPRPLVCAGCRSGHTSRQSCSSLVPAPSMLWSKCEDVLQCQCWAHPQRFDQYPNHSSCLFMLIKICPELSHHYTLVHTGGVHEQIGINGLDNIGRKQLVS